MSTKLNPGKFDCLAKCADDEPYFLLRAKDPISDSVVQLWRAIRAGDRTLADILLAQAFDAWGKSGRSNLPLKSDKSMEAGACAMSMIEWRKGSIGDLTSETNMISGPCTCGDVYCPFCGPAQGNFKCTWCGKWSMDGGCDDPKACKEAGDRYAHAIELERKQADEIAKVLSGETGEL
jgi:hypothetical protein